MATTPSQKSGLTILRNFRESVRRNTSVNNFDRDSKTRALMDTTTKELLELRQEAITAIQANQLSNADGEDLREFGRSRGVPQRDSRFARSDETERNVAYFVETGTFGSINGGSDILVPQGTVIFSAPNNNELGSTVRYLTAKSYILNAADALQYITVVSETAGAVANVGKGTLRSHEFTGYTDVLSNTLKVINFYPILNGRNEERPDQYRFRISQHYNRLHQNSDARILLTSLQVPGVLEVKPVSGFFGIGTVGVVVLGADAQSTPTLVSAVQARLNRFQGPGMRLVAVGASVVSFDLDLELKTARRLTQQERARLTAQVKRSVTNYFRSVGIAGVVRFEDLARSIQTDSRGLVGLGALGTVKKLFKNIFVRRGFSNGVLSEKERIINNIHSLLEDEYADIGQLNISFV